ncbi:unnamed protein product [Rotaria socialis]|uniref:BTB domain-containing protein n=1 Tax=Rotaria socialis TaxID=392032 RepID=A0A821F4P4_9BILA|nr:unnamed protein product [Rotaria socialis]CAF4373563.1 unnamed protein product [Rotaria socialis]CAF4645557.1 unnamed protein product [Rotaria socialis]
MMDIISVNKKSNNEKLKRVHSMTTQNISKYARKLINIEDKINVHDYFLHERPFTNVKIIINQQTVWCDKASLSAASPIFREQLLKNHKDEPLIFNDIDLNDFIAMLEFIYPIFNPEINEKNISCLVELSYRFQYDMLEQACQIYIMKYLSTIRRVFGNTHNSDGEDGDYFINNTNEKTEYHQQRDLIEFHNRTCVDALNIIANLCRWLKTYYYKNNMLPIHAIMSVLQQISINYLGQAVTTVDIDDEIKGYIYKARAQYLEQMYHVKHIA